jgi:hypothetical protein
MPHFTSRCAVTRELFDMICEMRLHSTSGGMEEHIKRVLFCAIFTRFNYYRHTSFLELHLKRYFERKLEYAGILLYGPSRHSAFDIRNRTPHESIERDTFSAPYDRSGYNDTYISDEMITELYQYWVEVSRRDESERFLRGLPGSHST